ncbi:unnamed protein product [Moneuplotes crassus]|uniref:Uncharacterized protein n=1 Tax=Euplotes crassus TaxID=5936 RepID=A0AAD1U8J3_EUPCR|nr:unnamed protein product [Moneuplotes crassus]
METSSKSDQDHDQVEIYDKDDPNGVNNHLKLFLKSNILNYGDEESFAFQQLYDEESILRQLMNELDESYSCDSKDKDADNPKSETIKRSYNALISLHDLQSKIKPVKDVQHIKTRIKELNQGIYNLTTKESQFIQKERALIEDLFAQTDEFLVDLTIKYFNNLKILKQLEKEKRIYVGKKLDLQKRLIERSEQILKFSSMVYFESNKAISIKKISHNNAQFSRCEKALKDNSFKDDKKICDFKLIEAYRIENTIKLEEFDAKLAQHSNGILKGLFSVIDWDQVPNLAVYGISEKKSQEYYEQNILRIPQNLISSCNLPEIVGPMLKDSQEVELPFHTSIYSTSKLLSKKLEESPPDIGECYYLLLSRAIVCNNNSKNSVKRKKSAKSSQKSPSQTTEKESEGEKLQVDYDPKEGLYTHYTYETVYPEYILIVEPNPNPTTPDFLETCDVKINELQTQNADLKTLLRSHKNNFWKTVKTNVQTYLHPEILEERASMMKTLKTQLSINKKELEQQKVFTGDLTSIQGSRKNG